jgi:hypothetical protein
VSDGRRFPAQHLAHGGELLTGEARSKISTLATLLGVLDSGG